MYQLQPDERWNSSRKIIIKFWHKHSIKTMMNTVCGRLLYSMCVRGLNSPIVTPPLPGQTVRTNTLREEKKNPLPLIYLEIKSQPKAFIQQPTMPFHCVCVYLNGLYYITYIIHSHTHMKYYALTHTHMLVCVRFVYIRQHQGQWTLLHFMVAWYRWHSKRE